MKVMTATEVSTAVYATVGGVLFLGTGVLLLFHCSSVSKRKKLRQVEDGLHHTGCDVDIAALNRKWRESQRKFNKKMASGLVHVHVPHITIIITPPSPRGKPRSEHRDTPTSAPDTTHNSDSSSSDVKSNDVIHDADHSNGAVTSTSLSNIRDVRLVTEKTSTEFDVLEDDDFVMRPRLASMEHGVKKPDLRLILKDQSDGENS